MKKDKNNMKKHTLWLLPLLVLTVLCLACGGSDGDRQTDGGRQNVPELSGVEEIAIVTPEPDPHRDELDAILKRVTMLEGVTINGVNVGGMTSEEAKAAVQPSLDAMQKDLKVEVTLGEETQTFSGETISVDSDLDEAIAQAFALVRDDTGYENVSREVERIKSQGMDFPVRLTFNETALQAAVNTFADAHETAPVNASVSYNKEENGIDFSADVPGRTVNREALFSALLDAEGGETLEAPCEEIPAEVTLADIQSKYVLRSTYTTKYSKSINNRKYNIFKGAGLITGTILHPGDVFSANGTLGVRNKANGWKVATAFVGGAHDKQYGGGVCQLSSTLYNAAVLADMKIVDRRNHSMPVDYVDKGRDATINSIGNIIDFKFENSSKSDIIIIAYVDNTDYKKAGKLTMEIWGIPISEDSNGEYDEIRIPTPKKTKTLKPSGEILKTVDVTKPVGYKEKVSDRRDGSVWESKKEYYLNGVLVKTEALATSTYKAYAGEYIVGPDAEESTKPDSTPKPDDPDPTPKPDDPDPTPHEPDPTPNEPDPTPHEPDPTPKPDEPDPTQPDDGDDG